MPKIDELRLICVVTKPDIVCVVDSWLCCGVSDSELLINDYYIIRLDRNRHGGGILFYIRSCFCSEVLSSHPFNLELIILSVSCGFSSCKFHIGLFYRPPSSLSSVFDQLFLVLQVYMYVYFRILYF